MDFLKNLGFDPIMLGAQILNFLIILFLLKRFLYKPVMDMIKKREDVIKEGLKQAEESKIALEKALEEEKKILKKAQDKSKEIIDNASSQALTISKEIEESAKGQAEKILLDAKAQIESETKEAEKRLSQNVSKLSIEILEKALKEVFGEKEEKIVLTKALKNLKIKK